MRIISVVHALRLRHIDLLCEMPIEKDVIYIKLAKALLAMDCNVKNSTDNDGIYHGIESLVKINTQLLVKAFSNKPSFIPCSRAIGILFYVKHPFVAQYILPRARGNKRPRMVVGSGRGGSMVVKPYLRLGLVMPFLE